MDLCFFSYEVLKMQSVNIFELEEIGLRIWLI